MSISANADPAEGQRSFLKSLLADVAVVVIVSVEVCAPLPAIVTDAGERLQEGGLLPVAGVIAQLRVTDPVKLFDGAIVMGTVLPVVAPWGTPRLRSRP